MNKPALIQSVLPAAQNVMLDFTLPERDSDVVAVYDRAKVAEYGITRDIQSMCSELNTSLLGISDSLKGATSTSQKIVRDMADAGAPSAPVESISNFSDLVRYTQICDHSQIGKTTTETVDYLKSQGCEVVGFKNYFDMPMDKTHYRGMHLQVMHPCGQVFELQIHSQESYNAKTEGHQYYEIYRDSNNTPAEKDAAITRCQEIHDTIISPEDTIGLEIEPSPREEIGASDYRIDVERNIEGDSVIISGAVLKGEETLYEVKETHYFSKLDGEQQGSCVREIYDHELGAQYATTYDSVAKEDPHHADGEKGIWPEVAWTEGTYEKDDGEKQYFTIDEQGEVTEHAIDVAPTIQEFYERIDMKDTSIDSNQAKFTEIEEKTTAIAATDVKYELLDMIDKDESGNERIEETNDVDKEKECIDLTEAPEDDGGAGIDAQED